MNMKIFSFIFLLFLVSLIVRAEELLPNDNYTGFVDLDTVSVVGFYENYPINFYLYKKLGERTDAAGNRIIECGSHTF